MTYLIVNETTESKGEKIRFMKFFRIGIVIAILSIIPSFGIIYIEMRIR